MFNSFSRFSKFLVSRVLTLDGTLCVLFPNFISIIEKEPYELYFL